MSNRTDLLAQNARNQLAAEKRAADRASGAHVTTHTHKPFTRDELAEIDNPALEREIHEQVFTSESEPRPVLTDPSGPLESTIEERPDDAEPGEQASSEHTGPLGDSRNAPAEPTAAADAAQEPAPAEASSAEPASESEAERAAAVAAQE